MSRFTTPEETVLRSAVMVLSIHLDFIGFAWQETRRNGTREHLPPHRGI